MNENIQERTEKMKDATKEILDKIKPCSDEDRRIIKFIYGFARGGFAEYMAGRKLNVEKGDVQ